MSNSIWKTPKESPRQEQLVAWVDRKGMHAGRFDTCYNCFCACAQYFVDLKKVKKWCSLENLEDLIAQADKAKRLEEENEAMRDEFEVWHGNYECVVEDKERLQKAVDLIANMEQRRCIDDPVDILDDVLQIAKDEIKQLIKEQQ